MQTNLDVFVILPEAIEQSTFASDPYGLRSDLVRTIMRNLPTDLIKLGILSLLSKMDRIFL